MIPNPSHHARAFTLVELIVVLVVVGILAGAIIPRLGDNDARRAAAEARDVHRVVSAAARRNTLSGDRLMIEYDSEKRTIALYRFRSLAAKPDFEPDPLVPPATLDLLDLQEALVEGRAQQTSGWVAELPSGGGAPNITLSLASPSATSPWRIDLRSGRADVTLTRGTDETPDLTSIDLDLVGMGEQPW